MTNEPGHQTGDTSVTPFTRTSHTGPLSVVTKDGLAHLHVDNSRSVFNNNNEVSGSFNTFQFWRNPIPDVPPEVQLDIDLEEGNATEIHVRARGESGTSEIVVRISTDGDSGAKRLVIVLFILM